MLTASVICLSGVLQAAARAQDAKDISLQTPLMRRDARMAHTLEPEVMKRRNDPDEDKSGNPIPPSYDEKDEKHEKKGHDKTGKKEKTEDSDSGEAVEKTECAACMKCKADSTCVCASNKEFQEWFPKPGTEDEGRSFCECEPIEDAPAICNELQCNCDPQENWCREEWKTEAEIRGTVAFEGEKYGSYLCEEHEAHRAHNDFTDGVPRTAGDGG